MHILITTPAFPPFIGGGERHTGTLARQLILRGHQVSVFTSLAKKESDFWQGAEGKLAIQTDQPGLTVIRTPIKPVPGGWHGLMVWRKSMVLLSVLPGTLGLLKRMARSIPPLTQIEDALSTIRLPVDIIHSFNISWEYPMLVGWQFAKENQIPFVASPLAHLGTGPRDRVARNSTMRHQMAMLDSADLLITNTETEAQGLHDKGLKKLNYLVAGPGVDIPDTTAPFPASGLAYKPYALFVGRANFEKGAIHAAKAVLKLREEGSKIHLVLIGHESEAFTSFYQKLSDYERGGIIMLGQLEERLKHAYLKETELLLLPSRTDSFGIVLLESWLYGRPVVAARAGGIPDVVDDQQNGILVPFGDVTALANAINVLVDDRRLNQKMGQNGHNKLMARFTWEAVTDIVLKGYNAVLSPK